MNFQEIYQMYDYFSIMSNNEENFYLRQEFLWLKYIYERVLNGYFE